MQLRIDQHQKNVGRTSYLEILQHVEITFFDGDMVGAVFYEMDVCTVDVVIVVTACFNLAMGFLMLICFIRFYLLLTL